MMKPRDRWRRVVALAVFVVLSWAARAEAAPILSFACDDDCTTVNQGEFFNLDIRIADVVDLVSYSFYLAFDPNVVRVNDPSDITYGGFLGALDAGVQFFSPCTPIDPTQPCALSSPLFIGAFLESPFPGVSGAGDLARIGFEAWGVGDSGLKLLVAPCAPDDFECEFSLVPLFFDVNDLELGLEIQNGRVQVDSTVPVPEPATIGLLSLGLLGVARRVRSQRRRRAPDSAI